MTRLLKGSLLVAVPVVALAVFGIDALSSPSIGQLPPVGELPAVPEVAQAGAAANDSPVVEVKTWEETAKKSPVKKGRRR